MKKYRDPNPKLVKKLNNLITKYSKGEVTATLQRYCGGPWSNYDQREYEKIADK